jgi:predicted DNA-binding transcriptional regulator AlpA
MLQKSQQEIPETGFLRLPEVLRLYPISKSTWWAGVKIGRYPQPCKLGERVTAWRAEDIRALIDGASSNGAQS